YITFSTPTGGSIAAVVQSSATSVQYATSSDVRLKENIQDTHYGIGDLMKIQVSDYNYKADYGSNKQTGYIAQQLYTVFPNAVHTGGDNPKTNPWMVDYGRITPLIVKAVQDQQAIIESQGEKIAAMQAEIEALKQLIKGTK
ncbi:MAG TPA: tail fiber domain-containing protein, partial [Chitinophagales bacterium]|nr:tail fiber domain-containing protein [Chitinophagales bacterium]